MHATLLIHFIHPQLHARASLFAKGGDGAGQVLNRTDQNFCLAYPLLLRY